MNNYCLTINVRSANKVLLDNMLVTLETFNENINEIETIEMFTGDKEGDTDGENEFDEPLENVNPAIYLECWMINEETIEAF